jgi:hypothetical protein
MDHDAVTTEGADYFVWFSPEIETFERKLDEYTKQLSTTWRRRSDHAGPRRVLDVPFVARTRRRSAGVVEPVGPGEAASVEAPCRR